MLLGGSTSGVCRHLGPWDGPWEDAAPAAPGGQQPEMTSVLLPPAACWVAQGPTDLADARLVVRGLQGLEELGG